MSLNLSSQVHVTNNFDTEQTPIRRGVAIKWGLAKHVRKVDKLIFIIYTLYYLGFIIPV